MPSAAFLIKPDGQQRADDQKPRQGGKDQPWQAHPDQAKDNTGRKCEHDSAVNQALRRVVAQISPARGKPFGP